MARLLTALLGLIGAIPLVAAPVPTHLMPKEPPVPFPTTVGTKWVYDGPEGEYTRVITDSKEKDGVTRVTIECRDHEGKKIPQVVWSISAEGVFSVSTGGVTYDPPWCIFKYPYREGQSWKTNLRTGGTDYPGTRKAGPMERVKVPAGEFTAVRVDWDDDVGEGVARRSTLWYAPGVGLVKSATLDDEGKELKAIVLKSFTRGKE